MNDEFSLTAKLGQDQANAVFAKHWETFIDQAEVNLMVQYGINSVRIPIGFWIIEGELSQIMKGVSIPDTTMQRP